MNSRCSCHLGKSGNRIFNFNRRKSHKVCKFIYKNNNIWKRLKTSQLIIRIDIPNAIFCKFFIASVHLIHCPLKRCQNFFNFYNNRCHKMRNSVVTGKLHSFWIYKNKPYFGWCGSEKKR